MHMNYIRIIFLGLVYWLCGPVLAECSLPFDTDEAKNYLIYANKYTEKCFTKEGLAISLATERLAVIKAPDEVAKYRAAADLIESVLQSLKAEGGVSTDIISEFESAAKNLRTAATDMAKAEKYNKVGGIESGFWDYQSDLWNTTVLKPLSENCNLRPTDRMNASCYAYFKENVWVIASAITIVNYDVIAPIRMIELEDEMAASNLRLQQWDSYFYDTQFQYPWELIVNFVADGGFDARFLDRDEVVPNSKWIILHPDVGLSVVSDGIDGNELTPSLTLQWLGFQRWGWKNGKANHPWGLSISSTYSDIAGRDDLGHGLSLLYDKYTLTVTSHSDELVYTLNLNLGALLNSDNKTARWVREKANF